MTTNLMNKSIKPLSSRDKDSNLFQKKAFNAKSHRIEKKTSKLVTINNENQNSSNIVKKLSFNANIEVDLDVTMHSIKDDSAIKEYSGEKSFREYILEGKVKNEMKNSEFTLEIKNSIKKNPNYSLNLENFIINMEHNNKFSTDEYRRMYTVQLRSDYSKSILKALFDEELGIEDSLLNHKVTERMRTRMIDWMIEVMTNYKCDDNGFFLAVNLMDRYFKSCQRVLQPAELHLTGVTCIFTASKYQDIYPLRLKVVYEKIAHKKLAPEDIKDRETEIYQNLNYIVGKPTQWEFINHYIEEIFYTESNNYNVNHKVLKEYIEDQPKLGTNDVDNLDKFTSNMLNLLRHVVIYLAKMNCHDYHLLNKKPSLIAASTLFVAMKICEQINKQEYVTDSFNKKLSEVSHKPENDIIKCAQKILYNAQNFDTIFPGLENLKKVHFNAIIELKNTK
jgi:hypothetical protein